jgi:hypothetical protein
LEPVTAIAGFSGGSVLAHGSAMARAATASARRMARPIAVAFVPR